MNTHQASTAWKDMRPSQTQRRKIGVFSWLVIQSVEKKIILLKPIPK